MTLSAMFVSLTQLGIIGLTCRALHVSRHADWLNFGACEMVEAVAVCPTLMRYADAC